MIPALQEDEEGTALEEEHSSAIWMVVHEAVSARELGALSEDLIGETSMG